jgi:KAP family P-loop domain
LDDRSDAVRRRTAGRREDPTRDGGCTPYSAGAAKRADIVEIERRACLFRGVETVADSFSGNGLQRILVRRPERVRAFAAAGLSAADAELAEQYFFLRSELAERPRTIVFRFNPWWFSGQDNLTRAFFDELATLLPEADGRRARDAARALARRYSGAGATALKAAASVSGVPFVGPVIGFFARLVASWAGEMESLASIKNKLAKALASRKHKVVVIIDDVDRLLPQEALQIFTLVKSVGDLPNVLYLLAYDQQLINEMLPRPPLNLRSDFLEKIVQYEAPVPMREPEVLPTMLLNLVNRIFPEQSDSTEEEFSRRFGIAFHFGVRPYIRQPREIARLANALSVALPALAGQVEPSRRFNALASIAEHSSGLPLIAQFVRSLGPDRSSQGGHEKSSLLTEQEFGTLRDIVLKRIRKLANDGLLWSVSDPAAVLWSWWAMGENDEAKMWVASQIDDVDNALHLMASMPTLVRSSSGNYRAVQKTGWQYMVDLDALTAKASAFAANGLLSENQKAAAREFLRAMEKGRY